MKSEFVDVKLNSHEEYIEILHRLMGKAVYVEIVQIYDDKTDELIVTAKQKLKLIEEKKVNAWHGTQKAGRSVTKYTFMINDAYWKYLEKFPSFFFGSAESYGCDVVEQTSFGQSDIAFLDGKKRLLFFTITHEGCALINRLR